MRGVLAGPSHATVAAANISDRPGPRDAIARVPTPDDALPLPSVVIEPGGNALDSDWPPLRKRAVRPVFAVLLLLAASAAGYVLYLDPARLREIVDSIATRW